MKNIDMSTLSPEVAAYIRSLEETVLEQKMELVKLQSLTEQLVNLRKKMYGQSSEKVQYVGGEQLSMYQDFFNEAETYSNASAPEPGKTTPVKAHERKSKRTKEELTAGLEHKKVLCELSPKERSCARCGTEMIKIGEKFARTELVIVPAQVYAVDYYVASYKCAHCEKETGESFILQTECPVPVMKKSMSAPATVAHIMQEKFQKGVPLYRQEEYWKSQGVDLQRSTMANWIIRSSRWFQPLWDVLRKELLSSGVINADETECHVLKEDGRESKQMSRMWVFCSKEKNISLYQYNPTRSGTVAKEMLKDYSGYLQTDGYSAYNAVEKATRVGCFAHARRKWVDCFVDGKPVKDSMSEKAFQLIERIFALESTWKELPPEKRLEHRQKELKPVLDAYWEHLNSFEAEEKTALYKAQRYSLNQREALEAVLLDGRLELTNNLAERSVKPFVMSRRNFLFCDTAKGATSSALCFSMIETAKANNLDPFEYLLFLLQELPKLGEKPDEIQLREYLPWATTIPAYCRKK